MTGFRNERSEPGAAEKRPGFRNERSEPGAAEKRPSGDVLAGDLARRVGVAVTVTLTENATTMVSYRWRSAAAVHVRIHRMFLEAESGILDAIAAFVRGNRGAASRPMDEYIRANRHKIRRRERRLDAARLKAPEGVVHDLASMRNRLNRRFFTNHVTAHITWGRQPPRRRRRHIGFGAYYRDLDLIRINPLLDQRWIPKFFVEYIVYHEMCHAFLAFDLFGRDGIHTPRFRELERHYPRFDEALAWERANLDRLLGAMPKRDRHFVEVDAPQMKKRSA